ncbi:DUF2828 family protein, partial [Loigolactobacillus coryniformis]
MYTTTQNGAVTLASSGDAILDFFFRLGASRNRTEDEIINDFKAAWETDPANRLYA